MTDFKQEVRNDFIGKVLKFNDTGSNCDGKVSYTVTHIALGTHFGKVLFSAEYMGKYIFIAEYDNNSDTISLESRDLYEIAEFIDKVNGHSYGN